MRKVPFMFIFTASIYVSIGMVWGIVMSATGDHSLFPAHAHLNLVGWVTMAIFGFYYHLVPAAAEARLAKIHFGVATSGLLILVPGIVMAITEKGDALAKSGAVLTLTSMLIFVFTVFRTRN